MLTVIGLSYLECDVKWANGYLPVRSNKCLKSFFSPSSSANYNEQ